VQRLRSSAPSRYLFEHPTVAVVLLFGLFVFVYLWPALVGGKILSPISLLYEAPPWEGLAPHDRSSYFNWLLSDVPTADYPWRFLIRSLLHADTFPSWNPYVFDGIPLWSNPQTGLFSIFSLPLWILPLNYGIGVAAALKLWAAGLGSFLLVRELRLGFLPGLLAGLCFSFSAIDIVWLTHETLPAVAALLPWMLWLVERIYQARPGRLGSCLGLAVASAIALGGGHPGMQVHVMAAAGVYALLRAAFLPRSVELSARLRLLGVAVGGLGLGALLMGAMLVPEALSSSGTIGTLARSHGRGTLPGTQMPLTVIRTVLFPDWWGRPSSFESGPPVTHLAGLRVGVNYNERTLYAGTVGLLLALVGAAAPDGWRRKGPFAVLTVLGLAIPLHFPGLYQLVTHLPLFDQVQNQRLHFVWAMGMSVLAAFGLQALLERPAGDRRRIAVGVGAVAFGVAMLLVALSMARGGAGAALGHTLRHFLTGGRTTASTVLRLTSVVWYLLFAVAVGAAVWACRRWPQRRTLVAAGIVLLAALDMLHFATGYQPMGPASRVIPPKTGAVRYLERHRSDGRIVGIGAALPNDWTLTYGLYDIRGYDPPQPSLRYYRLWQLAESAQLDWTTFALEALSPTSVQLASVLGARYVVAAPGTERPLESSGTPMPSLQAVYDGKDARVFSNARAAPRALVPAVVQVVEGEEPARATVTEPTFDPRRDAVVERPRGGAAALAGGALSGAAGRVTVSDRSNADVVLAAQLSRPGLVVLNDDLTPGWSVRVDGRAATALRVNDVMRGVAVPAGAHRIEWRYRVPGLRAGAALTLVALLALAAGAVVAVRRRRRGPVPAR